MGVETVLQVSTSCIIKGHFKRRKTATTKTVKLILNSGVCTRGKAWGPVSFKIKGRVFSRAGLFATPWTVARQAPLSMEFSRQGYWSQFRSLLQGIFPTQGWNRCLLPCQMNSLPLSHLGNRQEGLGTVCWGGKFMSCVCLIKVNFRKLKRKRPEVRGNISSINTTMTF